MTKAYKSSLDYFGGKVKKIQLCKIIIDNKVQVTLV